MNQFGVAAVEHDDTQEKFFLKPQKANRLKNILVEKTGVMEFIIQNLNKIIEECSASATTTEEGSKMKEEISD